MLVVMIGVSASALAVIVGHLVRMRLGSQAIKKVAPEKVPDVLRAIFGRSDHLDLTMLPGPPERDADTLAVFLPQETTPQLEGCSADQQDKSDDRFLPPVAEP
ncbi:MAG: hypothetical protein ACLPN6_13795 [Streptosporangiaceae bacterium]|jgi:hypothetical protein|nr:hypothetical protein [Actinomycetota bacterium]